ncbi:hypothetical protein [Streptomyces sp. SID5910]|uniref:hypothetical protein n=1 Tax=Streptomyces sp. SID5910 TaxID=2690312 RepID=UPI00136B09C7|nr:hypothetical protein [Streptomyces sp. SID5910]MYR43072.1 hypothetical protein [Streptomyces sp. SID5910]
MPRNDAFSQGIQYPVLGDAPDIEVATQTIVNGIVPQTVMRFANANARAAALSGESAPVPGMVTYLNAEDRYDRRDGDGIWRPLSPGPWKPFTFATGYSANSGGPAYRIVNGEVHLRGTISKSNGSALTVNAETRLGTLPTEARPNAYRYFIQPTQWTTKNGVSYFHARVGVFPDGTINYLLPLNSQSDWIGLDGIKFSIE